MRRLSCRFASRRQPAGRARRRAGSRLTCRAPLESIGIVEKVPPVKGVDAAGHGEPVRSGEVGSSRPRRSSGGKTVDGFAGDQVVDGSPAGQRVAHATVVGVGGVKGGDPGSRRRQVPAQRLVQRGGVAGVVSGWRKSCRRGPHGWLGHGVVESQHLEPAPIRAAAQGSDGKRRTRIGRTPSWKKRALSSGPGEGHWRRL